MLLNLIHKIKYLTDQFDCVFVFALATLNSYIYFCTDNTIDILTADNLLVAAYALSCLCIPVSNEISDFIPCAHAQSDIVLINDAENTDD